MASTRREGGAEGWEETRVVARLTTRVQGEGTGLRPRRDKTRTVHRPQNRSGSPRRALRGGGQCGRVETKRQAVENDSLPPSPIAAFNPKILSYRHIRRRPKSCYRSGYER